MIYTKKLFKGSCLSAIVFALMAGIALAAQAANPVAELAPKPAPKPAPGPAHVAVPVKVANLEPIAVVKLAQLKGRVMVNKGSSYTQASPGLILQTGTKIVTTQGAAVSVLYKDGCVKQLGENSMLTIGNGSECSANNFHERIYVAAAIGDEESDLGTTNVLPQTVQTGPAILTWSIVLLGSVVESISKE